MGFADGRAGSFERLSARLAEREMAMTLRIGTVDHPLTWLLTMETAINDGRRFFIDLHRDPIVKHIAATFKLPTLCIQPILDDPTF
jgi:cytosine/adenosine deaminase-related metal-dependent hydrolase